MSYPPQSLQYRTKTIQTNSGYATKCLEGSTPLEVYGMYGTPRGEKRVSPRSASKNSASTPTTVTKSNSRDADFGASRTAATSKSNSREDSFRISSAPEQETMKPLDQTLVNKLEGIVGRLPPEKMNDEASIDDLKQLLQKKWLNGLFLKRTTTGGCWETVKEFNVYEDNNGDGKKIHESSHRLEQDTVKMTIKESASCFLRCFSCCAPGFRETSFDIFLATDEDIAFLTHEKTRTNGNSCLRVPCFCTLPYLDTMYDNQFTGHMTKLGSTEYVCNTCSPLVPTFDVWNAARTRRLYRLQPKVCCIGGCCIKCDHNRGIPFYIHNSSYPFDPALALDGTEANITNLWGHGGFAKQNYSLTFPKNADAEARATLIGATLLMEMLRFG